MKSIAFSFTHAGHGTEHVHELARTLRPELEAVRAVVKAGGYADERASFNLPDDEALVHRCQVLAQSCKDVEAIVIIGIGGSNLGTMAIHEAINGKLYNAFKPPRIFFADTVDSDAVQAIATLVDAYAAAKRRVLLNVISKSGSTTETVANFEVLYGILKKHKPHPEHDVVCTTVKGSKMHALAVASGFHILEMPEQVGGRYSVFSAVGLFPLAVVGVDVHALVAGAKAGRDSGLKDKPEDNPALMSACVRFEALREANAIHDLFLFSTDMESVGKWWRQLVGESVGKEYNAAGTKQVFTGVTPTVSIGSTDLHSVGQLYLGGPKDKLTTFVRVAHETEVVVPSMPEYETLVPHIQGKPLHTIMDAILSGVQQAYETKGRPFISISLPEKNAYCLGQLMQTFMLETVFLARLLDVNPFDQPNVEDYKKETKEILRRG